MAATGTDALAIADDPEEPDLILLDLGLPDMDGIAVCRELRAKHPESTVVMLTARAEEIDIVLGLDAGADDYLTKPFRLSELLARIRAHLRRQVPTDAPDVIELDELRIDLRAHRVLVDGSEVQLRAKEFDLLVLLARDTGQGPDPGDDHGRGVGHHLVGLDPHARPAHVVVAAAARPGGRPPRDRPRPGVPVRPHPVNRRIFRLIMVVTALTLLAFGMPLAFAVRQLNQDQITVHLENDATRAALAVPVPDDLEHATVVQPTANTRRTPSRSTTPNGDLVSGKGPSRADAAVRRALEGEPNRANLEGELVVATPLVGADGVRGAVRAAVPNSRVRQRPGARLAADGGVGDR